jgi:hypothetical protein
MPTVSGPPLFPRKYTPTILRPLKGRIHVVLPYQDPKWFNRTWIKTVCGDRTRPIWNKFGGYWEISRSHFLIVLKAMLDKYGTVDIYEDHSDIEICNVSCQDAVGNECTCRCLGVNHGIEYDSQSGGSRVNWILVTEDTEILIGYHGVTRVHYTRTI